MMSVPVSRRDFLSATLLLPVLARQTSEARLIGTVPLFVPGAPPPAFGRLLGEGLDARLFTDLSTVGAAPRTSPGTPRTATEQFFVRTAFPRTLAQTDPWTLRLGGLVQAPLDLNLRDLEPLVITGGRYLVECS